MELNSHTNGPSRNQPALAQRMACFLGFVWPLALALARLEESETYSRRRNTTGRRQEDGSKTRERDWMGGPEGRARLLCRCNKSWLLHEVHAPEPGNPPSLLFREHRSKKVGLPRVGRAPAPSLKRSSETRTNTV